MVEILVNLVLETLRTPRRAAQRLMALNLSNEALWSAFGLVVVLNAFLAGLSNVLLPLPADAPAALDALVRAPRVFLAMQAVILGAMIATFTYSGNLIGGTGRLRDVAVLMIWMQALRLLVQLSVLVLTFAVPVLATLVVLGAAVWGLWILVSFLDEAHQMNSLFKTVGVIFLGSIAIAFLLSTALSVFGLVPPFDEINGQGALG
jgi:hypothetical protein